jgi:uncharacterized membrane protein
MLVHFPIAFLTLYTAMEVFRIRPLRELSWWFPMKAFLVILGSIAIEAAIFTGGLLEEKIEAAGEVPRIVEVHEQWAKLTAGIYAFLALAYLIVWMERTGVLNRLFSEPTNGFRSLIDRRLFPAARYLLRSWFAPAIAVLGFVALTITGALGGSMVYGPDIDPAARVIYDLLIGQ